MVGDKDITTVLSMMPDDAVYYFCSPSVKRALPALEMQKKAEAFNLKGETYSSVEEAYNKAKADASEKDFIFVGGSSFVVADLFSFLKH
jgi:dihydrofolate synthase/folylpolyglutamate synthase